MESNAFPKSNNPSANYRLCSCVRFNKEKKRLYIYNGFRLRINNISLFEEVFIISLFD